MSCSLLRNLVINELNNIKKKNELNVKNPISPVIVKDEEVESLLPPDIEIPHLKIPSSLQLTFEALMCRCSLADETGKS